MSLNIDPRQYNDPKDNPFEGGGGQPIPKDTIVKAVVEQARTKDGKGAGKRYYDLEFQVVEGEFSGRRFWEKVFIEGYDESTASSNRRKLSRIAVAAGHDSVLTSFDQFTRKPMMVKLGIEKGTGGYPDKNKVIGVKRCGPHRSAPERSQPAQSQPAQGQQNQGQQVQDEDFAF